MVKYLLSVEYQDGRLSEDWELITTRKAEAKRVAKGLFADGVKCVDLYAYSKQYGTSYQGTAYSVEDVKKW